MTKTIGTFVEFKKAVPDGWVSPHSSRAGAVKIYLSTGGVVKVSVSGSVVKIVYPTHDRLKTQLRETERKLDDVNKQLGEWAKRREDLSHHTVKATAKRVTDPVFWEHHAKRAIDPTYRKTYELVEPPMHLLHRKEWRKRLKLFVKSKEYRLRLHEARTSAIGKKREGMTKEVEKRFEFSRGLVGTEKKKILEKKKVLHEKKQAIKTLMAWVEKD